MKLYGVYDPSGKLRGIAETKGEAKTLIFDLQSMMFRIEYPYQYLAAYRAAKKLGWKIEIGAFKGTGKFL